MKTVVTWAQLSTLAIGSLAATALAVGCSGSSSTAGSGASGNVEIYSWWVSGSEKAALSSVLSDYAKQDPTVTVTNAAEQDSMTAQADLTQRMQQGNPPDTFQVNGGADLMQYVVTNGQDDSQSKLESLDFLAAQQGWTSVIPPDVLKFTNYNGHMYAVPVDIARINALFYNKAIFANAGLTPPTTMAEFVTVAKALQAQGITPLAIGDQGNWTLEVIFKGCLVAEGKAAFYNQFVSGKNPYFSGTTSTEDSVFEAALADFGTMVSYANTNDMRTLTWDQAVDRVANGGAAMTIMGDWALGEFIADGKMPDVDFGEVPVPDSADTFIFTTDTFVLPKGAPNRNAAISLLTEFGSVRGQDAFNPIKGSVAPRTDADSNVYNSISAKSLQDFRTLPLVGDFALTVAGAFITVFDNSLDQFATDGIAQNVVLVVKNNYDTITTVGSQGE